MLAQTYGEWELLIVEDGSQDESFAKAQAWMAHDSRIHVWQHEGGANRGVSASRNLAIRHARGEYLAILDCDDVWLADKLGKQIAWTRQYPDLALAYGKAEVIDEAGELIINQPAKLARLSRPPVSRSPLTS